MGYGDSASNKSQKRIVRQPILIVVFALALACIVALAKHQCQP
jgi:hypothetical protein